MIKKCALLIVAASVATSSWCSDKALPLDYDIQQQIMKQYEASTDAATLVANQVGELAKSRFSMDQWTKAANIAKTFIYLVQQEKAARHEKEAQEWADEAQAVINFMEQAPNRDVGFLQSRLDNAKAGKPAIVIRGAPAVPEKPVSKPKARTMPVRPEPRKRVEPKRTREAGETGKILSAQNREQQIRNGIKRLNEAMLYGEGLDQGEYNRFELSLNRWLAQSKNDENYAELKAEVSSALQEARRGLVSKKPGKETQKEETSMALVTGEQAASMRMTDAIARNDRAAIMQALQGNLSVTAQGDALRWAAEKNDYEVVQQLIKSADLSSFIDSQDADGKTALMIAADKGLAGIVNELLQAGANPNVLDKNGHPAYFYGRTKAVRGLLEAQPKAEETATEEPKQVTPEQEMQPISGKTVPAIEQKRAAAEAATEQPKATEQPQLSPMAPSIVPVSYAASEAADKELFAATPADPRKIDLKAVQGALNKNPREVAKGSALRSLAPSGEQNALDAMRLILSSGNPKDFINQQNTTGNTPLMVAAGAGNIKAVELLLSKGANRELKNEAGEKAYDLTFDPDIRALLMATPAEQKGAAAAAAMTKDQLLQQFEKADTFSLINLKKFLASNPSKEDKAELLRRAARNGLIIAVHALLNEPDIATFIDIPDETTGLTALMMAAYQGHYIILRELLADDADPELKSKEGKTALDLVKEFMKNKPENAKLMADLLQRALKRHKEGISGKELEALHAAAAAAAAIGLTQEAAKIKQVVADAVSKAQNDPKVVAAAKHISEELAKLAAQGGEMGTQQVLKAINALVGLEEYAKVNLPAAGAAIHGGLQTMQGFVTHVSAVGVQQAISELAGQISAFAKSLVGSEALTMNRVAEQLRGLIGLVSEQDATLAFANALVILGGLGSASAEVTGNLDEIIGTFSNLGDLNIPEGF